MNKLDLDYQNLLKDILENGVKKETRNGETTSVFGRQIRHNMKNGFPLLTTKKMPFKTIVTELLWFLRGDTNIKYLVDNNCHIWDGDCYANYSKKSESQYIPNEDGTMTVISPASHYNFLKQEEFINRIKTDDEFANKWGELGPIYGKQWRSWRNPSFPKISKEFSDICDGRTHIEVDCPIDQIQNLINDLKTNPDSRRLMVNAWNVGELDQMVLPPCHYGFQVYTRELKYHERRKYRANTIGNSYEQTEDDFYDLDKYNIPTRAISLMWNQRSVDTFLGLPFNIASYGLLLEILAKEVNMVPEELIGNLGDVHLYSNHIEQAKEQIGRYFTIEERTEVLKQAMGEEAFQIAFDQQVPFGGGLSEYFGKYNISPGLHTREPFPLPTVTLPSGLIPNENNWDKLVFEDFYLNDYQSHPTIKAPLSN